jgi:hypothetical protein
MVPARHVAVMPIVLAKEHSVVLLVEDELFAALH